MPKAKSPTIIEDLTVLADLYVDVFRMMGRRITRPQKPKLPVLPDEMLPPPLPEWYDAPDSRPRELVRQ
jgi:hypothetical protein